jgi:hypothetical protein
MIMIGETLGNYRVVSVLAHGAMGAVHLAEHITLGKKFSIKSLSPYWVMTLISRAVLSGNEESD